jgi:formate C-acetyltransferase
LPHYGNGDEETDAYAHGLMQRLSDLFRDESIAGTHFCMPGTFSYISHATLGSATGATFDGRRNGKSLSDGCCPVQGRDTHGPTALIRSLTGWDQTAFLGGMVINLKFSKSLFTPLKKQTLIDIIGAFIHRGGIEMQINCVDKKTLEDACIHPEAHRDLIVRIGGYSDYFVKLSPTLKAEIIERTEY